MEPIRSYKRAIEQEAEGMEHRGVYWSGSFVGRRTPDPVEAGEGIALRHFER